MNKYIVRVCRGGDETLSHYNFIYGLACLVETINGIDYDSAKEYVSNILFHHIKSEGDLWQKVFMTLTEANKEQILNINKIHQMNNLLEFYGVKIVVVDYNGYSTPLDSFIAQNKNTNDKGEEKMKVEFEFIGSIGKIMLIKVYRYLMSENHKLFDFGLYDAKIDVENIINNAGDTSVGFDEVTGLQINKIELGYFSQTQVNRFLESLWQGDNVLKYYIQDDCTTKILIDGKVVNKKSESEFLKNYYNVSFAGFFEAKTDKEVQIEKENLNSISVLMNEVVDEYKNNVVYPEQIIIEFETYFLVIEDGEVEKLDKELFDLERSDSGQIIDFHFKTTKQFLVWAKNSYLNNKNDDFAVVEAVNGEHAIAVYREQSDIHKTCNCEIFYKPIDDIQLD